MRKLAIIEFVTLDGVMQGFGSPDEDRDGGFDYGGWGNAYGDEVLAQKAGEGLRHTSAYLLGRKTYLLKAVRRWLFEPKLVRGKPEASRLPLTVNFVIKKTEK